jgi:hypothetical protein
MIIRNSSVTGQMAAFVEADIAKIPFEERTLCGVSGVSGVSGEIEILRGVGYTWLGNTT